MSNAVTSDWTPDMIAILKRYWGDEPARQIGRRIGKSKNAVIGKADRLRLRRLAISPLREMDRIAAVHARVRAT